MFNTVLEVKRLDIDIFKGEHKKKFNLIGRAKFVVRTFNRDYVFFARTVAEREIWVESFSKVIESNEKGASHFNLKTVSHNYLKTIDQATPVVQSVHRQDTKKRELRVSVEGGNVYKTEQLEVNRTSIAGFVMKAV